MASRFSMLLMAALACGPKTTTTQAPIASTPARGADPALGDPAPIAPAQPAPIRLMQPDEVDDSMTPLVTGSRVRVPIEDDDLWMGADEPTVVAVVFIDYQCPHCTNAMKVLGALTERYPRDVRVVIKHFPLKHHNVAETAARAAIAAAKQGRFWSMHQEQLAEAGALTDPKIVAIAQRLGLDMGRFHADVASATTAARVRVDAALAEDLKLSGIPTVMVNGRPDISAHKLEDIVPVVEEERRLADTLLEAGAQRRELYARFQRAAKQKDARVRPVVAGRPDPNDHFGVPTESRPMRGEALAPVTIIEFADFQCPFSNRVRDTLAELRKKFPGKVRVIYRNLPLGFHKQARLAARAALAADRQGKFWKMHDKLFNNQRELSPKKVVALAKGLKLNMKKFKRDLNDPAIEAMIVADEADAKRFGVRGTPAFFVNGRFLSGAQPVASFAKLVTEELKAAKKFRKAAKIPRGENVYDAMIRGFKQGL